MRGLCNIIELLAKRAEFIIRRVGCLACVLMAVTFIFMPSAKGQVNAEQVMNIGRNVLSLEDYMLAIQYFNQAIKAKPYLSDPYYYRALAKLSLDDYRGAEEDCNRAIELNKFKTEAYKVRGFALQQQGKDSLALRDYNMGLQYNPHDRYFLFYKGVAQSRLKQYEQADSTLTAVIKQNPKFGEAIVERARLNVLRGDTTSSLADLDEAAKVNPSIVNVWLLRADIRARRKQWEEASEDMQQAIRLEPQQADLYVNRAYIRYNLDDYFGAMSDYNYALELEPQNSAALFNRALLRFEVKDLKRAESDFSKVLDLEPENYHAAYNRGLVRLETGDLRGAEKDFRKVLDRYPRFYTAWYALGEAYRRQGDMRRAVMTSHHGEELVRQYVKNPKKNPLERPAIAAATSNQEGSGDDGGESETEVMERFNQLRTFSAGTQQLPFNDRIKGRVQDRDVNISAEPSYMLTFTSSEKTLRSLSNYFRELDDMNQARYLDRSVYLAPAGTVSSENEAEKLFDLLNRYDAVIAEGKDRPVDFLARGILRTQLRDYAGALSDFDRSLELSPDFTPALLGRAFVEETLKLPSAFSDYDHVLRINPRLIYAWFNKGNIYYANDDYTSALESYNRAIEIDPEFGEAYYNRGLCYLQMGARRQAFSDLSKAGELGVLPSYNLLKRMRQ